MEAEQILSFGPYRLHGPHGPLLRRSQEVKMPPQALAVLWYLVSRAGQVVTKDELLSTVWAGTVVGDEAVTSCLRRLRRALDEDAEQPRYIATVHRIGYRFIGQVVSSQHSVVSREEEQSQKSKCKVQKSKVEDPAPNTQHLAPTVVGRDAELTQLHSLFAKALNGERQLVFITGEAGIGKTSLVDTFLHSLQSRGQGQEESQKSKGKKQKETRDWRLETSSSPPASSLKPPVSRLWVAQGQCIEHYGTGEAYLPVLEALGRLCRHAEGEQILGVLRRVAPSWLLQLPALLSETELATVQQKVAGITRERMLREIVEALEALNAERPLVLVLEDVHWSDASTIDLLSMLVRRRETARLLVLATSRQAELVVSNHPLKTLKQELVTRGHATEMLLGGLQVTAVQQYVEQQFAEQKGEAELATWVYRRTEGHPLFMVQLTEYLEQRGELEALTTAAAQESATDIPPQLRELIEVQVARLTPEEQRVLEVGSVAGAEFPIVSVAAALGTRSEEVETLCEQLAQRRQFIVERELVRWPDGTVSGRYGFRHTLYQEVLYQRVSASRRVRLHRQIGEREETGYGERAREVAAELAVHFERGQDYARAVQYLEQAGENAFRLSAHPEALALLTKGLAVLTHLSDTPERAQQELRLLLTFGPMRIAAQGQGHAEVGQLYTRALVLCQQVGSPAQRCAVLAGLRRWQTGRGNLAGARAVGEQLLSVAQEAQDPRLMQEAQYSLAVVLFLRGELCAAFSHLEQSLALADHQQFQTSAVVHGPDTGFLAKIYAAFTLCLLGYPDQARQSLETALVAAQAGARHAYAVLALGAATAIVHQLQHNTSGACERAELGIHLGTVHGIPLWRAVAQIIHGWALVGQGQVEQGVAQLEQGLALHQTAENVPWHPYHLALLAEAYGQRGDHDKALRVLAEALATVGDTGERFYEAEIYRLRGELTFAQSRVQGPTSEVQENQKAKGKRQKLEEAGG